MAAPLLVRFSRYATLSFGLISQGSPNQILANGIGLVTRFVEGEIWGPCCDPVSTTWTDCYAQPVTVWTEVSQ